MSLITNNKRTFPPQGNGEKVIAQGAPKRPCFNGELPNDQLRVSNASKQVSALQELMSANKQALASFQLQHDENASLTQRVSLPNTPPSYPQPMQQMGFSTTTSGTSSSDNPIYSTPLRNRDNNLDLSQAIATCKRIAAENEKMLAYYQQRELKPRAIQPKSIPSYPQPMQQMGPAMMQRLPLPEIEPYSYSPIPPPKTISMEYAEYLHNQGLHFDSLLVIEEVLEKDPANSDALMSKLDILQFLNSDDYLVGTELLFIKIKDLVKQRKWDESLKIATLILKILPEEEQYKPMQAIALTYQAKAYMRLGRTDEFRNCMTEALAKDPLNKSALQHKFNEFLDFANSILANDPANKLALQSKIDALTSIIGLLVEQKKTKKALAKIEMMLRINPDPLFAMMKRVYDLKGQNRLIDAKKIGEEALRACSNYFSTFMTRQKTLEYQSIQAIWVHIMNQLQDGNSDAAKA